MTVALLHVRPDNADADGKTQESKLKKPKTTNILVLKQEYHNETSAINKKCDLDRIELDQKIKKIEDRRSMELKQLKVAYDEETQAIEEYTLRKKAGTLMAAEVCRTCGIEIKLEEDENKYFVCELCPGYHCTKHEQKCSSCELQYCEICADEEIDEACTDCADNGTFTCCGEYNMKCGACVCENCKDYHYKRCQCEQMSMRYPGSW